MEKKEPEPESRHIFTDGFNSFSHFLFGILAVRYNVLVILFITYQYLDVKEINVHIDVIEFVCGFTVGILMRWNKYIELT